ncbi:MAG: hypothetical protein WHS46_10830 [Desulfosoma sp.]
MRVTTLRIALLFMWVIFPCVTTSGHSTALDIPLNIRDVSGVQRTGSPVSFGIPFPQGVLDQPVGIVVYDPSGNPVPSQFKILERWVDHGQDGSVKWLLVTFLADVPPNENVTYRLGRGVNPSPARAASLEDVYKLWDEIDFEMVLPDGTVLHRTEGVRSIIEDGPVRCCVKFETDSKPGQIGYIAWLYAYAGGDRIDVTVVLKNTPRTPSGPLFFKDFSVLWRRSGKEFEIGGDRGKRYHGVIEKGKSVYLYQDSSGTDRWDKQGEWGDKTGAYVPSYSPISDLGYPAFKGYIVQSGKRELARGEQAIGWVRLGDHGVVTRDFWQQFPKAVEVEADRIRVRLWPQYWKAHGGVHWLDDMQRKAHDLAFFYRPIKEADALVFNFPLTIHCGLDWYRQTGAVGYLSEKTELRDQPDPQALGRQEYGWHKWGTYWLDPIRRRYHHFPMDNFIKTGDPYEAKKIWLFMRGSAGLTPAWVDHYKFPEDAYLLRRNCYCCPLREPGSYTEKSAHHGLMPWNMEHLTCRELHDGYRLFGDLLAYDAVDKLASWVQAWVQRRSEGKVPETRVDALPQSVLADSYRLLERPFILNSIRDYINFIWNTINKDRGYYIPNVSEKYPEGFEKVFMLAYLAEGLEESYKLTGDLRCVDMIYGITRYALREPFINSCYAVLYESPINLQKLQEERAKAARSPTATCDCSIYEGQEKTECRDWRDWRISSLLSLSYIHYRDPLFLDTLKAIDRTVLLKGGRLHANTGDSPSPILGVYDFLREKAPLERGPSVINDLKATVDKDGRVRLQWTNPPNAHRYYIKYSDKPIKESITIPDDIGIFMNFWSAEPAINRYDALPRAGSAGHMYTYILPYPGTARQYWFAVKSLGSDGAVSGMSNTVQVSLKSLDESRSPAPPQNLKIRTE